jgi:hypothetical protein
VERLIVEVQTNGPICIKGSFDVLGRTAIDGKVSPREDAEVVERVDVGVAADSVSVPDVTCRALTLAVPDDVTAEEVNANEVNPAMELEPTPKVVVEAGSALGTEDGICTGQKDQTFLPSSQYKSISNLRNPEARRFDKQSAELSSSYRRNGKHAALKDTPGVVT